MSPFRPSVRTGDAPKGHSGNDRREVEACIAALPPAQREVVQAVRAIVLAADERIAERVMRGTPSFHYRPATSPGVAIDMAAFHLRDQGDVQLLFVFPKGLVEDAGGLLQGDWPDRRDARFIDLHDVAAKKADLLRIVQAWTQRIERP